MLSYFFLPQNLLDKVDIIAEYALMEPLPIQIPPDYAAVLGCDGSHISHANAGRRQFTMEQSVKLVVAALTDPRIEGLTFYDLRRELKPYQKYLSAPKKKGKPRARR